MKGKFLLYLLSTILVIWSMESVNINQFFKKNKVTLLLYFGLPGLRLAMLLYYKIT